MANNQAAGPTDFLTDRIVGRNMRSSAPPPVGAYNPLASRMSVAGVPPGAVPALEYGPMAGQGAAGSELANIQPSPNFSAPAPGSRAAVAAGAAPSSGDYDFTQHPPQRAAVPAAPAAPAEGSDTGDTSDTIGRALIAFSHGMAATPAGAAYNPIGGAIAGGLAGVGQSYGDTLNRRMQMWQMQNKPLLDARAAGLKAQAEALAKDPFEAATQGRTLDRQTQDIQLKADLAAKANAASTAGLPDSVVKDIGDNAGHDANATGTEQGSDQWWNSYNAAVAKRSTAAKYMQGAGALPAAAAPSGKKTAADFVR